MTDPRPETVEREQDKLYITDAELGRRLGVPLRTWRAAIREFDRNPGFPKKQAVFGGRRYWPAVKDYLDRMNGLNPQDRPRQPLTYTQHKRTYAA